MKVCITLETVTTGQSGKPRVQSGVILKHQSGGPLRKKRKMRSITYSQSQGNPPRSQDYDTLNGVLDSCENVHGESTQNAS